MKRSILVLSALILLVSISSCRKDDNANSALSHVDSSDNLVVPDGFTYNTTDLVSFRINSNTIWGKEKIRVDIYDLPPSAGGSLLFSGFANGFGELTGSLELSAGLNRVFVELISPDGNSLQKEVSVIGSSFACQFGNLKSHSRKAAPISPECNAGCILSLPGHSGTSTIKVSDAPGVYCFTGSMTGNIIANHPGSVVRICGNANMHSIILNNGAKLEVADGAILKVGQLEINSPVGEALIYNADVHVLGSFSPAGMVRNFGRLEVDAALNITGLSAFENYGELRLNDNLNLHYQFKNYYQMSVARDMVMTRAAVFNNHCSLNVDGQLKLDGTLNLRSSLMAVAGKVEVATGGILNLGDAAMLRANDLTLSGSIIGEGNNSLVKVLQNTEITNAAQVSGKIDFCDENGIEVLNGSIVAPATQSCGTAIHRSSCNPEGNGTGDYLDSDNDGVRDALDHYPNQAATSGIVSYPSANGYATLAFEDLWPNKGDYDFNDLVLDYRHNLLINADNKVVQIESEFIVTAMGGSFNKGFGYQLNIAPNEVASVSGQLITKQLLSLASNGTENGQSKAVIMIFDNVFKTIRNAGGTAFINTVQGEPHKDADTLRVTVKFVTPQSIASLGPAPFNPFIYVRDDRSKEIHMINQPPTDLLDQNFFGNAADVSDPSTGKYYLTEDNHPWVLNVVGDFAHPVEKSDIIEGYIYFDYWAQSGGSNNVDWHVDHSGYRNKTRVY